MKHIMIDFKFIFPLHSNIFIYIYCIYSLNCLWQQIKSDIHVKFVLIKLYKIAYYEKILQLHRYSSQKTDRWTEVWRLSCITVSLAFALKLSTAR